MQREQKRGKHHIKLVEAGKDAAEATFDFIASAIHQAIQKRARRAYTPGEIQNLLNVAGPRQPIYLLAALTGIRRGEIKKLRWADFKLDDENPAVTVSAAISKNHYEDPSPLHPDLVAALKPLKLADCKPEKLVFKGKPI